MRIVVIFLVILLFCGCSFSNGRLSTDSSFIKTIDGGEKWELKTEMAEGRNISGVSILSMVADSDNEVIYIGTAQNGIFKTENNGERWTKLNFPPKKVYGIAIDKNNNSRLFASGVWQGISKIYRSEDGGANWQEVYTEPSDVTVITTLAINSHNSNILYAGNSEGALFKSDNAGETWYNLYKAPGAVTQIIFDSADSQTVYFLVLEKTLLITRDGGKTFNDLGQNITNSKRPNGNVSFFSVAHDPGNRGTVYVGYNEGILKSSDFGENWVDLNVLESSKNFPVRAIAINPKNSNEIIYCAARAIYKSVDGGARWSTFELATSMKASVLLYNKNNPLEIYAAFKK